MRALETTLSVPLVATDSGPIHVAGTRVSLDSIVHQFNCGATPEHIAQSFPPVSLQDVYAVIAFYLNNRTVIDEYIEQQEREGDAVQQRIEADAQQQEMTRELRERMLKRWAARSSAATAVAAD